LDTVHHAQLTYNAMEHQNEAQRLAFGGVLSTANLPRVQFTPDYDYFSGSFRSAQSDARLTISGGWFSRSDLTTDRFAAASRYTFNGLETSSGHILTGYGIASFGRAQQRDTFFNLLSDFGSQAVTTTTKRYESYNDSFNGALVNQRIQRAAQSNPYPSIPIHFIPSPSVPYDQRTVNRPPLPSLPPPPCSGISPQCLPQAETTKRSPPSVFPPPPLPPRPQLDALSNGDRTSSPPPQVKGVLMPATVVKSKPKEKADTSDIFGSDHKK